MKKIVVTALLSCLATLLVSHAQSKRVKLENAKVRVTEMVYEPGVPRDRYIRPTDQVIVFLDESKYERKDSKTGAVEMRERKSGDVIWHDKGEDAPVLTNRGAKAYRTLVIELK